MSDANADQRRFWSDEAGPTWVAQTAAVDATFAPVLEAVLAQAKLTAGEAVVDVGCGAGTSSLGAAEAVGPSGHVLGLDISDTLLTMARENAPANTAFLNADAQMHGFEETPFDALISRFGVMFFADTQAAFTNMANWLKPGGRMAFATWGQISENPFFTLPAAEARAFFGPREKTDPDAPGPFALRDVDKMCDVLRGAGLQDVRGIAHQMLLTPPGDRGALTDLMCKIGPAQSALTHFEAYPPQEQGFRAQLHAALARFETPQGLRIPAEINIFTGTKAP